jgi:hypothetical protein
MSRSNRIWTGLGMLVAYALLSPADGRGAELDFRTTPYAEDLLWQFESLMRIGNQGSTEWEKLSYDTETRELTGRLAIKAKHSWGTISWTDYFSIPPVKNKVDLAVEATAKGEFLYKLETGQMGAGFRVPLGERSVTAFGQKYSWNFGEVRLSGEQIKRILDGDLTAFVDSIPTLGFFTKEHQNDYQATRERLDLKYGAGNVYLCRKQVVDQLAASKGFNYIVSLIATAGQSSGSIMRSLGSLATAEVGNFADWLQQRGVAQAQQVAGEILAGEGVRIQNYYVALKWTPIEYRNRALFANEVPVTPWLRENHGAFYVIVKARNPGDQSNVDSDGFDRGPHGGDDFPDRRPNGQIAPEDSNRPFFEGVGIDASDPEKQFELDVFNKTGRKIRVTIVRGANDPDLFSRTIQPGDSHHTHGLGISERILGVWELDRGRLTLVAPVVIDQDLHIIVGRDVTTDEYWYQTTPRP